MFNEKAQIAIYDVMFAVFIFVMVFAGFNAIHNENFQTGLEVNALNYKKNLAHNAMEVLIDFEGSPTSWTVANVILIGLAEKKGMLSEEKVIELTSMDYEDIKSIILFGKYNFFLEIDSENPADDLNIGMDPSSKETVIKVERKAVYKEAMADVRLSVFE